MDKPDYVYVLREESGDPSLVKIGHSIDPVNRPSGFKAGNYRRLLVLFTLLGGQDLETELHIRFAEYKIGTGGDEWFKLAPDMISFLQEEVKRVLIGTDTTLVYHKRYFGSPISIPSVELGEVEPRTAPQVAQVDSVQPHSIAEVEPPKDPRFKVGRK